MPIKVRPIEEFTPELRARWERARDLELAGKEQTLRDLRLLALAAEEVTFAGRLRRAIHKAPLLLPTLCEKSAIALPLMGDFLRGEAKLDSAAIDRLVAVLGWPAIVAAESEPAATKPA